LDIEEDDLEDMDEDKLMMIFREQGITKERSLSSKFDNLFKDVQCKYSFYLFSKKNCFRIYAY